MVRSEHLLPADSTDRERVRARVFISYSRRDSGLANQIVEALERHRLDPLIDHGDLPFGVEFQPELSELIASSDAVVYILSPSSLESLWCNWELDEAYRLGKRLVPLLREKPREEQSVPEKVSKVNWIPFEEHEDFDARCRQLIATLTQDIDWLKAQTVIMQGALRWNSKGAEEALLLRGVALEEAEAWLAKTPADVPSPTDLQRAYVSASREAETRRLARERAQIEKLRQEQERRAKFQRRFGQALLGLLALVVTGALATAWSIRQTSVREGQVFASLADQAFYNRHYDRALRYAVAGMPPKGASPLNVLTNEVEDALSKAAQMNLLRAVLKAHRNGVVSADFSLDGKHLVTGSNDRTAIVWKVATGEPTAHLLGHTQGIWSAEFSPDGERVVTASRDRSAIVWDANSGKQLLNLKGHQDDILTGRFDATGEYILTGSRDRTAKVWNSRKGGTPLLTLKGHREIVVHAEFSRDGKRVLTASYDGTARIWDAKTGALLHVLASGGNRVLAANFDPMGRQVVTANDKHTLILWDVVTGQKLRSLSGHTNNITSVAFSPDGSLVMSTSKDHTARIWSVGTYGEAVVLAWSRARAVGC